MSSPQQPIEKQILGIIWAVERYSPAGDWEEISRWDHPKPAVEEADHAGARARVVEIVRMVMQEFAGDGTWQDEAWKHRDDLRRNAERLVADVDTAVKGDADD